LSVDPDQDRGGEDHVTTGKGDLPSAGQATSAAYVRFALGNPDAYPLIFDLSQPHPDRYPELAHARARRVMNAAPEKLVRAGIFAGDPDLLGYVFWATLHGLVVLRLAGKLPAKPTFRTIQPEALRLLMQGARGGAKATHRIGRRGSRRKAKRPAGSS
jgi:hypothetical protein